MPTKQVSKSKLKSVRVVRRISAAVDPILEQEIGRLSNKELAEFKEYVAQLSPTNCAAMDYWLQFAMTRAAEMIEFERAVQAKEKATAAQGNPHD